MGTYVDKVVGIPPVKEWLDKLGGYASISYDAASDMADAAFNFSSAPTLGAPIFTPPNLSSIIQ